MSGGGGAGGRSGQVGNDRASCRSVVSIASEKSVWSVNSSIADDEGNADRGPDIDWDNLDRHTVVQLKEFLRNKFLPVSGKKDILIERLRSARDETSETWSPSSPRHSKTSPLSSVCGGDVNITKEATVGVGQADEGDEEGDVTASSGGRVAAPETQLSLRERLQARARDRATAQKAEADVAWRAKDAGRGSVGASRGSSDGLARHGGGRSSGGDENRVTSRPTLDNKCSVGLGTAMAPPSGRKPLGVLDQGNPRVGVNQGDRARPSVGANGKTSKPSMKHRMGHTSTAAKSAGGGEHRVPGSTVSPTSAVATVAAKTAKHDSANKRPELLRRLGPLSVVTNAARPAVRVARPHGGAGASVAGVGAKRVRPGVVGKPERARVGNDSSDHGRGVIQVASSKREREDVGRSKAGVPSFLKPTKSSGGQVSTGWQEKPRFGGAGRGGSGSGGGGKDMR